MKLRNRNEETKSKQNDIRASDGTVRLTEDELQHMDNVDVHADGAYMFIDGIYTKVTIVDRKHRPTIVPRSQEFVQQGKTNSMVRPRTDTALQELEEKLSGLEGLRKCDVYVTSSERAVESSSARELEAEREERSRRRSERKAAARRSNKNKDDS
jgi:hypothetical protein